MEMRDFKTLTTDELRDIFVRLLSQLPATWPLDAKPDPISGEESVHLVVDADYLLDALFALGCHPSPYSEFPPPHQVESKFGYLLSIPEGVTVDGAGRPMYSAKKQFREEETNALRMYAKLIQLAKADGRW